MHDRTFLLDGGGAARRCATARRWSSAKHGCDQPFSARLPGMSARSPSTRGNEGARGTTCPLKDTYIGLEQRYSGESLTLKKLEAITRPSSEVIAGATALKRQTILNEAANFKGGESSISLSEESL